MRWIWLTALLLVVGGVVAFFALREGDEEERAQPRIPVHGTVSAAEPETIGMPDLLGLAYPDAVEQALAAGLFPNSFSAESGRQRGTVVDQRPGAGAEVAPGATIRIDVSRGLGPEVERQVPDLTGLELPDALRACAQAGFTCRAVPQGGSGLVVRAARALPGGSTELAQIELAMG